MKKNGVNAVNNQEDEDGYLPYPSCPIIEKRAIADPPPPVRISGDNDAPLEEKKLIHGFVFTPGIPLKD